MGSLLNDLLLLLGVVMVILYVLFIIGIAINEIVAFFTVHRRK